MDCARLGDPDVITVTANMGQGTTQVAQAVGLADKLGMQRNAHHQ